MTLTINSLFNHLHALWWLALLVLCVGAALAILIRMALEARRTTEPGRRLDFDDFDYFYTRDYPPHRPKEKD